MKAAEATLRDLRTAQLEIEWRRELGRETPSAARDPPPPDEEDYGEGIIVNGRIIIPDVEDPIDWKTFVRECPKCALPWALRRSGAPVGDPNACQCPIEVNRKEKPRP